MKNFGETIRDLRTAQDLGLRETAIKAGISPAYLSRIERGIWPPPQDADILERYAHALEMKEGTDEWYRFFDSAAADRGIVPRDIMDDKEVVKMLPVFFRTLRGTKPTEAEMKALVEKIRRS